MTVSLPVAGQIGQIVQIAQPDGTTVPYRVTSVQPGTWPTCIWTWDLKPVAADDPALLSTPAS